MIITMRILKVYIILFFFPGRLGAGWAPAVLNSQVELDFIKEAQKGLSHDRSYWIGGSTDSGAGSNITFSNYNTNSNGGNLTVICLLGLGYKEITTLF